MKRSASKALWQFEIDAQGVGRVSLSGAWHIHSTNTSITDLLSQIKGRNDLRTLILECSDVASWDSTLVALLVKLQLFSEQEELNLRLSGVPDGALRLLELSQTAAKNEQQQTKRLGPIGRVGNRSIEIFSSIRSINRFIGEMAIAIKRMTFGQARTLKGELLLVLEGCGPKALPIVLLINLLVGLILAYIGAIQLERFGATIYVANLVGIAIVREMGAVMTGVIMAGRTGAAFAAELGTMEVNEELDALKTLGLNPIECLVLPRIVGLVLMMPLLTLFANVMGILGGVIVGVGALDISWTMYIQQTKDAIGINNLWIGLVKSLVFGALVAGAGCYQGINCGRNAAAVGHAVTRAVVIGIVSIIVADAVFAILCNSLGI